MSLEDEGQFMEAEADFIAASKANEAVDMWIHQRVGGMDVFCILSKILVFF